MFIIKNLEVRRNVRELKLPIIPPPRNHPYQCFGLWLFMTSWTIARQAPPMGFSRQKHPAAADPHTASQRGRPFLLLFNFTLFRMIAVCSFKRWGHSSSDLWICLKAIELHCNTVNSCVLTFWWDSVTLLGFPGGSEVKASACNSGDMGLIPGFGRSTGGGNGNPLQYSCLKKPMDGGAWWATVHGVLRVGHDRVTSLTHSMTLLRSRELSSWWRWFSSK